MSSITDQALDSYFAERERQRNERVADVLRAMTKREKLIFREAAVMGYVRGLMAVGGGVRVTVPADSLILAEVIGACLAHPDLYPTVDRLETAGCRKRIRAGGAS